MIICGIDLSGSNAQLVLLDGTKEQFQHIDVKPRRLSLDEDENADAVRAFRDTLDAFFRENNVGLIAIKKRNKRGEYAGGPVGFKIEGLTQLYSSCDVDLVSPQTIAAAQKKHSPQQPSSVRKYQQAAFLTAFSRLN